MKIWIDVINSPQVLFFDPIYRYFKDRDYEVIFTARKFAQTVELLDLKNISYVLIGKHPGKNLFDKITDAIYRSIQLLRFARKKNIDLCLSHNSHHISITAKFLDIPCISMFDYEHALVHHISVRLAHKVIVPSFIGYTSLKKYGCERDRLLRYEGLKEQIYLSSFDPNIEELKSLKIDMNKIIVTIRPPGDMAHYHTKPNTLYPKLLSYLSNNEDVQCIILPRNDAQKKFAQSYNSKNFIIPAEVVDGPNLIYHSDLVISGGGTINREAVVLGIPVYTIFSQKIGAIDKSLIEKGLLKELRDIDQLKLSKYYRENKMGKIEPNGLIDKIKIVTKEIGSKV